jgi:hypothetical protein
MRFSPASRHFLLLTSKYFPEHPFLKHNSEAEKKALQKKIHTAMKILQVDPLFYISVQKFVAIDTTSIAL